MIEKMKLINIVAQKNMAHTILKDIILTEKVHLVDSLAEINKSHFKLNVSEDLVSEVSDLADVEVFSDKKNYKLTEEKLLELIDYKEIEARFDKSLLDDNLDLIKEVDELYQEYFELKEEIDSLNKEKEDLETMRVIEGVQEEIDFKKLFDLENFNVKMGILSHENQQKLINNYGNIYATVLDVGNIGNDDIYVVITLKNLEVETDRLLRSLYFKEIPLLDNYLGTKEEMQKMVEDRLLVIEERLAIIKSELYKDITEDKLLLYYSNLVFEKNIDDMKKLCAVTSNYIYIIGFIGESDIEFISNRFESYGSKIVFDITNPSEDINPPTKLKNNWLFKPFESIVGMYGIPSYTEIDPTGFVAISYMLLFGAMFGDLGQGLLLFIMGYFIQKKSKDYGGILMRISIFSMLFGILYDSFFGYEHIISKVLPFNFYIRPIENINLILISGVISGLVFLMISYGYSIVNKLKNGDIKEGIFGKNGINGVVLFLGFLLIAGGKFLDLKSMPYTLIILIIVVSLVLLVVREPLSNKIKKKIKLYEESKGEYYVESGFELLETFLSMFSNTLSFIRVGAFSLNHVGLFMAFHTIASLMGGFFGNLSMFIVGNVIVIGLEGLIVLIQGLRLVYYEMFSKYYDGDGIAFTPAKLGGIK